jgi:hypothetical protein
MMHIFKIIYSSVVADFPAIVDPVEEVAYCLADSIFSFDLLYLLHRDAEFLYDM